MHVIHQHQTTVTLFKRNGDFTLFPSMKAALRQLGYTWIVANVGVQFRTYSHHAYIAFDGPIVHHRNDIDDVVIQRPIYAEYDYIMRSDTGDLLTAESFAYLRTKQSGKYTVHRFHYVAGDGPVPLTGRQTGCHHYFRNIRHINAKRGAQYFSEEGERAPRSARRMKVLLDSWDDLKSSARRCRNWKRYRKVQWR